MFSHKRLTKIFLHLYNVDSVEQGALAKLFSVSERTIRTDIREINKELSSLNSEVYLTRKKGYSLKGKENLVSLYDKLKDKSSKSLESSQDRINQLLWLLLVNSNYLTVDYLCDSLFVSKTTLLNYIRQIRSVISKYQLEVKSKSNIGYKIAGLEENIRRCMYNEFINVEPKLYTESFTNYERGLFQGIDLDEISDMITNSFPPESYHIRDYHRRYFAINLGICILRNKNQGTVSSEKKTVTLFDIHFQSAMEGLFDYVEKKYGFSLSTTEKQWLYMHFLSGIPGNALGETTKEFSEMVDDFLSQIYLLSGINLQDDNILRRDLEQHFSTYLPLKDIITNKSNPILETIKNSYPFAFNLTLLSIEKTHVLSRYNLSEDELGYVAIHLASALERHSEAKMNKKKIIIICGDGISVSRLIETVIRKEFSNDLEIIDTISHALYKRKGSMEADFIVSTIPIKESEIPVVQFDFLDMEKSISEIALQIKKSANRDNILELFEAKYFFYCEKAISFEDSITMLSESLSSNNIVKDNFYEKVLEREHMASTVISEKIAIPHAIGAEIFESKIAVLVSKEPILWLDNSLVNLVLLLAVSHEDKHKLRDFFEALYCIIKNPNMEKEIPKIRTYEDFKTIL